MKLFQIKAFLSGKTLFETECGSLKICLQKAVETRAYLRGADLRGAYLTRADLTGTYGEKNKIKKTPLQILGLQWEIYIFDNHMKIGCEFHEIKDWTKYDNERINDMDSNALEFWKKSKKFILDFCKVNGRK